MSWTDGPLLGFDTETTGVDVDNDRIVTAALVRRDASGTHVRSWLINPGVAIPDAAAAIHGVSTEHARTHGRPPREALEEIAADLAEALRGGVPVVAYNAVVRPVPARRRAAAAPPQDPARPPVQRRTPRDRPARARPRGGPVLRGASASSSTCAATTRWSSPGTCTPPTSTSSPRSTCSSGSSAGSPTSPTLDLDTLHEYQSTAHQAWAESFNAWRAEQGFDGPGASDVWPTREPVGTLW